MELYQVIVDGQPWADPDGNDAFPELDAFALADDLVSRRGYSASRVEIVPA